MVPKGGKYTFTLNSNHEMYDGGIGYFTIALGDPSLKAQKGTSYFSFSYGDYIFFGLDSAYFDPTPLYKSGMVSGGQQRFIAYVVAASGEGKQIVVMSHHNPITFDAKKISVRDDGGSIANDICNALGGKWPDYWYYGHLHNGIVYNETAVKESNLLQPAPVNAPKFRCMGHGGIPIGNARALNGSNLIDYYA